MYSFCTVWVSTVFIEFTKPNGERVFDTERILDTICSAKIVIGDVDEKAGMGVVEDIISAGGYAHF